MLLPLVLLSRLDVPAPNAAPPPPPALEAGPEAPDDRPRAPVRFVLANTYGLHFGLAPAPSGEAALFVGGSLPTPLIRPGQWIALGYHGAVGGGSADDRGFATTGPRFVHRHHVALIGVGGPKGRFGYGLAVGLAFSAPLRAAPALEAEGKVGYVFGRPEHRNQGIVGAQLRISGSVEVGPSPQLGVFVGFVHAPFTRQQVHTPATPPSGAGLLVPGVMLVASGVLTAVTTGVAIATRGRADALELWSYTGPYALTAVALGAPLVAVGAVRLRRYRRFQLRAGGGVAMDF